MAGIKSIIPEDYSFTLEDMDEDGMIRELLLKRRRCDEYVCAAMEAEEDEEELEDDSGGKEEEGGGRDKLLMLYKVAKSAGSYERQQLPYMVLRMCRNAVADGTKLNFDDIMQSVQLIINDTEAQVRVELVKWVPKIVMVCLEAPHLFGDVVNDHFLAIILKYLQAEDNQVRLGAQTALLGLIEQGLLDSETIEDKVYPVVDSLLSMSPDHLNLGLSLLGKIAPLIDEERIGKVRSEVRKRNFEEKFIALCSREEFFFRKVCAAQFPVLCSVIGKEDFAISLFPIFLDLCADEVWGVRKACVDSMMAVSCCLSLPYRRLVLADAFATLLNDESKWVRMSAYQILGPFISTFAKQFAEVTYDQEGELVFTTKGDKQIRLPNGEKSIGSLSASTRYWYEGIFPTKCAIRSEKVENAQQIPIENLNTTTTIEASTAEEKKPVNEHESEEEEDEIDINILVGLISKINSNQRHKREEVRADNTEKYNPFLYYYIPPDLPLDCDLVEAAKISASENRDEPKSGNSTPTFETASSSSDSINEDVGSGVLPIDEERSSFKGEDIVPRHLIDAFLSMAETENITDMITDVPHYCAFSFPAVTLTVGRENWPYLKKAYESLANACQWKVRGTLASSIHEMALILGNDVTVSDLIPIYDGFLQDLDEVRISVLKHLATFLKLLKSENRNGYLPRLKWFLMTNDDKSSFNWRVQEELAIQLLEIVYLFTPSSVRRDILPLAFDLVKNKIAAVRHVALSLMAQIVAHLSVNNFQIVSLFRRLRRTFTVNTGPWIQRQMYALLCAQLIDNNAISGERFSQELLPSLLTLSRDKVPNVRLAVARTLSKHVITMGPDWLGAAQMEEVDTRLKEMRLDPDRDVRVLAGGDETTVAETITQNKQEQSQNILF